MKLRTKIKVFSLIILCTMTLAIVLVGTFIIDETVYDLNRRLMSLEIANLLNRIHQSDAALRRTGASGIKAYVRKTQQELVEGFTQYAFAATGDLFVVEEPHTRVFHKDETNRAFISSRDIDEMFARKEGFIELQYGGKKRFCAFQTFKPWNWLIGLSITKDEMFAKKTVYLRQVGVIAFGALFVSMVLWSLFVARVARRIESTLACARQVEAGDLSARIDPIVSHDEIGSLQQGINSMVATIEERTSKYQASQEALRESEEKYRSIFENAVEGIFQATAEGKLLGVNPAMARMFGCASSDEMLTRDDVSLFKLFAREEDRNNVERLLAETGKVTRFEAQIDTRDVTVHLDEKMSENHDGGGLEREMVGPSDSAACTAASSSADRLPGDRTTIWVSISAHRVVEPRGRVLRLEGTFEDITERKLSEEALIREKTFTERALDTLTDTFIVFDFEGKILRWNKAVNELTGLSDDQICFRKPADFFPRREVDQVRHTIQTILKEGHATLETSVAARDGSRRAFEFTGDLLKDHEGNPSSICVIGRDVTRREAAEENVRRQNEFLHSVLESLTHPFYVINADDYTVITANSAAGRELDPGVTTCYHLARGQEAPCGSDEQPCPLEEVKRTGRSFRGEHVHYDRRGNRRYLEIHAYPLFDRDGKVTQIIEYTLEITDRKRVEQALAEREEQYRRLTEGSLTGIYIHQDGLFAYVNERLAEMLGYSVEELTNKQFWEFVHPGDREAVKQRGLARAEGKEVPPHYEFRAVCKTGETKWLELLATTITYRGRPANMGNVADVSERKRSEQEIRRLNEELERRVIDRTAELEAVNRELKDFAYVVSHDLRAPLRAINQLATWIREDYAHCFDDEGKEQVALLLGRVKRMENLIEGVLQYSRIGRTREEQQHIDSEELVQEAIDLVAPPKHVRVLVDNGLPTLIGEPTRLRQVFQNLIDNAVKYMDKPEGEIRIACADEDEYWRFSVSDNGPGIHDRYHERIFQIFQTLASRDQVESTGIGLTLVKKIVELSGGRISLTSELGKGTTFHFTLPKGEVLYER